MRHMLGLARSDARPGDHRDAQGRRTLPASDLLHLGADLLQSVLVDIASSDAHAPAQRERERPAFRDTFRARRRFRLRRQGEYAFAEGANQFA